MALGAKFLEWRPPLPKGAATKATFPVSGVEIGFNAEVQPPPTIAALSATAGVTAEGTPVTITGGDLEGASAVKFGAVPASFSVVSENQIAATALQGAAGSAPISVTTISGTATSTQLFNYATAPSPGGPQTAVLRSPPGFDRSAEHPDGRPQ